MSVFKCKMCGGTIEFEQGATVGVCDSCGTKQTLPRLDDDRRANLYDRANHFRRNNEFDKAAAIYEQILNEDGTDAEAYWSLVLCHYGIEYVEDPATHKRVPTVNRAQYTAIFDDENYKSALQYADGYQRELYEQEAKAINDIQKGILAISQKEEPFDVFICYKETDSNGRRTPDSVLANDLYHQLVNEGFKVFFSRITLEDKLGTAYEPYIFAALNSAKVMVVLGTKPEYFNAVWVKNEWSRFFALVKTSGGKKILIPAYKDMDPYDLPEEFSHLQAQDMSKLGFMQDLIRGIKKITNADEPKASAKETVVVGTGNANIESLLKRAFIFLEDGNWNEADKYCEKVLDQAPENAEAYLCKLMAEQKVRNEQQLETLQKPFSESVYYQKILLFGDNALKDRIQNYSNEVSYRCAEKALSAESYARALSLYRTIPTFRDAGAKIEFCEESMSAQKNERDETIEQLNQLNKRMADETSNLRKKQKQFRSLTFGLFGGCVFFLAIGLYLVWGYDNDTIDISYDIIFIPMILSCVCLVSPIFTWIIQKRYLNKIAQIEQKYAPEITVLREKKDNLELKLHDKETALNQKKPYQDESSKRTHTPSTYSVILVDVGPNKIQTINAIRQITNLGLADAKKITDEIPSVVITTNQMQQANQIRAFLNSIGAHAEIE